MALNVFGKQIIVLFNWCFFYIAPGQRIVLPLTVL